MFSQNDFEEFVISNRISTYMNYDSFLVSKCVSNYIINKWKTIIDASLMGLRVTEEIKSYLCLYCEILELYKDYLIYINNLATGYLSPVSPFIFSNSNSNLDQKISFITNALNLVFNRFNKRSKILDKYYNYATGKAEYLLEDGTYVTIDDHTKHELKIPLSDLPPELLILVDDSEYRNYKINQVIDAN